MSDAIMKAVYGFRGMGKSSLVKQMMGDYDRIIVLDPMGEFAYLPGFKETAWTEIPAELAKPKFKISYKPRRGAAAQALHHICERLLEKQAPYAKWMAQGRPGKAPQEQILLVIEEMALSFPSEKLPSDLWGMGEMSERGRHSGIEVIGTTQRPASVSTKFKGLAEETYCFRLTLENDVNAVCTYIGKQYAETIMNQDKFEYLHKTISGVEPKKTQKP